VAAVALVLGGLDSHRQPALTCRHLLHLHRKRGSAAVEAAAGKMRGVWQGSTARSWHARCTFCTESLQPARCPTADSTSKKLYANAVEGNERHDASSASLSCVCTTGTRPAAGLPAHPVDECRGLACKHGPHDQLQLALTQLGGVVGGSSQPAQQHTTLMSIACCAKRGSQK
jgi:hypothetical protein